MLKYLFILVAFTATLSFAGVTKAESIYWIDDGKKIRRAALDGSNITDLVVASDQSTLHDMEVTDSFIYWVDWVKGRNKIYRSNLDGSNVTDLIASIASNDLYPISIEVTDSFIYWVEKGKNLRRANLDGSNVRNLVTVPSEYKISNLVVNSSFIYWTTAFSNEETTIHYETAILRAALDGSNITGLLSLENRPDRVEYTYKNGLVSGVSFTPDWRYVSDMEVTDSFIYWVSSSVGYGNSIQRSNLDGSGVGDIIPSKNGDPNSLMISSSYIFWTTRKRIYRANLDGSNVQLILKKGLKNPSF
jgi:hypothetical protein